MFSVATASAFVFHLGAHAQFDSASVLGYIRDAAGASVPAASVKLTNVETGVTQMLNTDKEGKFEFSSVRIGDYKISAEANGFSRSDRGVFSLSVNARQRVDLALKAGSVSEVVTV